MTNDQILSCPLTKWSGDLDTCRWCDRPLTGKSRVWHSKRCSRLFYQNHYYKKARTATRLSAKEICECPDVKRHMKCSRCRKCEGEIEKLGGRFECHHVTPLRGSERQMSCLNHLSNLIMVCSFCHRDLTNDQKLMDYLEKIKRNENI